MLAVACGGHETKTSPPVGPALDTTRIAIVGASVSAGFGGAPFSDAFRAAAKRSAVESAANVFMFRDPINESRAQIDKVLAFKATTVIAIDFLFWDLYGSPDPAWREDALAKGLAELERARASGAWIVVGDIPHVVTAAEWMLPRSQVPDAATLATANAQIEAWAKRERVVFVPFAAWAAPLAANEQVEIAPGEKVAALSLVAPDGLHANALGVWFLLDKLDHFLESKLPGTPKDALVFARPTL
ncbi:MAG: hypothetical protein M4D80_24330 [Myxococcota bacterium]|nr:hypothetical protein [Myxococcota bacterium]